MNFQEVRRGLAGKGGLGRGRGQGGEGSLPLISSPQNVTLAMAVFTILTSIYFFNKVSRRRAEVGAESLSP